MNFKFNGVETDGKGNPELQIPAMDENGLIPLEAGDSIEVYGLVLTAPCRGFYRITLYGFEKAG